MHFVRFLLISYDFGIDKSRKAAPGTTKMNEFSSIFACQSPACIFCHCNTKKLKKLYIFCIDCFAQSCHRARARIEGRVFGLLWAGRWAAISGPVNCILGNTFTAWSGCDSPYGCGTTGTQTRTRSGDTPPTNGGAGCPSTTETQTCTMPACAQSFAQNLSISEHGTHVALFIEFQWFRGVLGI